MPFIAQKPQLNLRLVRGAVLLTVALGLVACSVPDAPTTVHDPYENTNRRVHDFNRSLDRGVVRPVSQGYDAAVPDPVQTGVSNLASNFSLPGKFVNAVLQGDVEGAGQNFFRFAVNTLVGFGGILDPATEFGIPEESADFGETLAVWGVPEGAYQELPLLGPSTERHTAGRVVDIFTNPLSYVLQPPESYVPPTTSVGSRLGDRARFSNTIDSILYESADSYAQSRLIYLQNRRFELGTDAGADVTDPYEDPYDEIFAE